ncbi:CorA metal ion transporter [Nowakowskiella sp. JEL0078]|nr:CorA metal ion transporter [Nowakowskiella sp. JEL0078]
MSKEKDAPKSAENPSTPALIFSFDNVLAGVNIEQTPISNNEHSIDITNSLLLPLDPVGASDVEDDVCFPHTSSLVDTGISFDALLQPPSTPKRIDFNDLNHSAIDVVNLGSSITLRRRTSAVSANEKFKPNSFGNPRRQSTFEKPKNDNFDNFSTQTQFEIWSSKVTKNERRTSRATWKTLEDFRSKAKNFIQDSECFWLDVMAPTDSDIRYLSQIFGIHPLTVEDIDNREDREKCEQYASYSFIATRYLDENDANFEDPKCIYIIVRKEGFHYHDIPFINVVNKRIDKLQNFVSITPGWINYALIDTITDSFEPLVEGLETEVENIDELTLVLRENEQSDMLRRIGSCRKIVTILLRLSVVKLDMIKSLIKRSAEEMGSGSIADFSNESLDGPVWDAVLYLGDVKDHLLTMVQELASLDANLTRAHQNYLAQISIEVSQASNKTNEVVGQLTFYASILVPLNLVTGLFGMNVKVPWRDEDNLNAFNGIIGFFGKFVLVESFTTFKMSCLLNEIEILKLN